VAIALAEGNRGPARGGAVVVAGQALVAILIGIDGDRNTIHVVDHILDLGLGDQLLALQYAAKQQADNDQNDGDFDQGETALLLSHGDPPRMDAAVFNRIGRKNTRRCDFILSSRPSFFLDIWEICNIPGPALGAEGLWPDRPLRISYLLNIWRVQACTGGRTDSGR